MIELKELSGIGFGCHHLNTNDKEHEDAIIAALEHGCKVIDTSSNYQKGMAEVLLGKVLKNRDSEQYFLISKGGSISNEILEMFNRDLKGKVPAEEVVCVSEQFYHSIHPLFLETQLERSLSVMNQSYLDGYLLHNPEYYLESEGSNPDEFYRRITQAFVFLEEQVEKGKIRYYGLSESSGNVDFARLIQIAENISSSHHFKLMQFPFNAVEKRILADQGGKTNLDILKENGIVTFGNRPFTGRKNGTSYHLLARNVAGVKKKRVLEHMDQAFYALENYAETLPSKVDISESQVIQYIYNGWESFNDENVFDAIYSGYLMPYIYSLGNKKPDANVLSDLDNFSNSMSHYLKDKVTERSRQLMVENGQSELFDSPEGAVKLCQSYLGDGLDVVLCGMKRPQYVTQLNQLF